MGNEIIEKKSEQIHSLLLELKEWTDVDFEVFDKTVTLIRSCERNIELLVELASDINANIILQKQGKTRIPIKTLSKGLKNWYITRGRMQEID